MASLASSISALLLLRRIPIHLRTLCPFPCWSRRFSVDPPAAQDVLPAPAAAAAGDSASFPTTAFGTRDALLGSRVEHPDYRRWKEQEEEILNDVEPVILLAKEILHSDRYKDGERLSEQDEKVIIDKLLSYHPHAEDKIGCGLDSIMVDRHPQFKNSRCLFVVRTDGAWIDFSYQKCLRAYIRGKYPSYADRFIKEHFKR